MKILIIEDEPGLRQSIQEYLEHQGYVCEAVDDFSKGMEKIALFNYDCLVVDIGLPKGSGLDIV
ncbi:MAG TPA: response regulator, partial [Puia sp.]|nr:response regulator [Puia sp.]